MSNNELWHCYFGCAGPHTTLHCHHFQIVDLTMMHCKRTMNGLNLCALPCEPEASNNKLSSEAKEERKVKVEQWTEPNDYVRVDSHVKTHDNNEEGKM